MQCRSLGHFPHIAKVSLAERTSLRQMFFAGQVFNLSPMAVYARRTSRRIASGLILSGQVENLSYGVKIGK